MSMEVVSTQEGMCRRYRKSVVHDVGRTVGDACLYGWRSTALVEKKRARTAVVAFQFRDVTIISLTTSSHLLMMTTP
eukprot:398858-Amphidinium_carterae.1